MQRTGPDTTALKQKSTGKLKSEHHRPRSSTRRTGPDTTVAVTHKSTGKPHTESYRPTTQNISTSFTDPPLTDRPKPASTLAPGLPHYRKLPEGIASQVWRWQQKVSCWIDLQWNCLLKKGSCRTSKSLLSRTSQPQRSRHTGKQ